MIKLWMLISSMMSLSIFANSAHAQNCRDEFLKETIELPGSDAPKVTKLSELAISGKKAEVFKLSFAGVGEPQIVLLMDSESTDLSNCRTQPLPELSKDTQSLKTLNPEGVCATQTKKYLLAQRVKAPLWLSKVGSLPTSSGGVEFYVLNSSSSKRNQVLISEYGMGELCEINQFSF